MLVCGDFYYFPPRFNLWKPFEKPEEINLGFEDRKFFSHFLILWHFHEDKSLGEGSEWRGFIGPQGTAHETKPATEGLEMKRCPWMVWPSDIKNISAMEPIFQRNRIQKPNR